MNKIALAQKVEFINSDNPNQGTVVIEPCYPGYGTTLGNSLRRILLSSLDGAAVVGVKIKGADHEFMTIPHVKEDILEIILNLKKLRLKVHSDEIVKLELEIHGEKSVTAGDIKPNSLIEISNKDLVIANITNMAGSLEAEIYVSKGRGYETIESRESSKHEIGYIEMDSIYSPVFSVGCDIENTRVGKMTNWDKLVLNILTDGTITVEEAFNKSVEILIEQFGALIGEKTAEKAEIFTEPAAIINNFSDITEIEDDINDDGQKKRRGRPKKV